MDENPYRAPSEVQSPEHKPSPPIQPLEPMSWLVIFLLVIATLLSPFIVLALAALAGPSL
jgi:hypothetical protein